MTDLLRGRRIARGALVLLLSAVALSARAEGEAKPALPLEIGRALELARQGSDEVLAKRAAAEAALRAVDVARANFFPKLSASVSGMYLVNPPAGVSVKAGSLGNLPLYIAPPSSTPQNDPAHWISVNGQNLYTGPLVSYPISMPAEEMVVMKDAKNSYFKGNLTFTQPIFVWGKIKAAVELASLESQVAAIGSRGAVLDAQRSANRAYYSALLSHEGASILEELRALASSILKDLQSSLDEGFATKEQLLSGAAELAGLEAKLVQAQEGERSSLEGLALLTGLDPESMALVSPFRDRLPPIDEARLKEAALGVSTDLGIARARLAQARKKLDLERGSSLFLPDLSFFASLDASGQDIPFSADSWKDTWSWDLSLGLAAKADFFDGGASAARKREASSNIEAARAGEAANEKAARLQVRRAIDSARGAEASLREKEARAAWAAEALRNARARAADQSISRPELNASAIAEASARLELLYARYALEEAIADLERAAGGSL
jgi:outer membrane protein